MEVTVNKMNKYLMFKLPSAFLCGVKLRALNSVKADVTVKYKWMNQNPFNSMYFAVQAMAAEFTTGALVMLQVKKSGKSISMLVANNKATFTSWGANRTNPTVANIAPKKDARPVKVNASPALPFLVIG